MAEDASKYAKKSTGGAKQKGIPTDIPPGSPSDRANARLRLEGKGKH